MKRFQVCSARCRKCDRGHFGSEIRKKLGWRERSKENRRCWDDKKSKPNSIGSTGSNEMGWKCSREMENNKTMNKRMHKNVREPG